MEPQSVKRQKLIRAYFMMGNLLACRRQVCQIFEAFLESVTLEGLLPTLPVVRITGVKPVTLTIYVEIDYFGQVRSLHQDLSLGYQPRNQRHLGVVQVKNLLVDLRIEVRIGEKHL